MTSKYQRPSGAYAGQAGLGNRSKYQDDATAVPKRAISSAKMDGDLNYLVDALNQVDEASGVRGSIAERLDVALNADGTLKFSTTGALDEWIVHVNPGAIARVDNATFTLAGGDYRAIYGVGRRVRVTVAGAGLVGDVVSCAYGGGLTSVALGDVVDAGGVSAVIASAPTQVAYGPVTGGVRGNMPRRADALMVTAGTSVYKLSGNGTDLVVTRDGSEVARVAAGGVTGMADGSVGISTLGTPVQAKLVPSGVVSPFAGSNAPAGWMLCGGQAVSRTTYADLFSAIGTSHGAGDGSTTFNVPDLRGRAVFGLDNMGGTAAGRVTSGVSGLTGTTLGASGGSQAMHGHTHTITDPGHTHAVDVGTVGFSASGGSNKLVSNTQGVSGSATTGISVNSAGAGGSQNMPPAMMLNYIIKT